MLSRLTQDAVLRPLGLVRGPGGELDRSTLNKVCFDLRLCYVRGLGESRIMFQDSCVQPQLSDGAAACLDWVLDCARTKDHFVRFFAGRDNCAACEGWCG